MLLGNKRVFAGTSAVLASLTVACSSASSGSHASSVEAGGPAGAPDSSTSSSTSDDGGTNSTDASSGSGGGSPADGGGSSTSTGGGSSGGAASASSSGSGSSEDGGYDVDAALAGWTLTWSDEFNAANGSAVDPTKWTHDVGGSGWGNEELEYYTDGTQNAVQEDGYLVVTAATQGASQYQCSYPKSGPCEYTSARIKTEGLFSQEYGRFEARAQLPTGQGLWPAIWMLGNDISTVSWPACGEIDFMETIGSDITTNHGSLHMPDNYGPTGTYTLADGGSFADGFHTFAIEWAPGTVRFYVDDNLYETQTSNVPAGDTWEFNGQPFFLIINVAVGGQWPGSPNSTTVFPQTLKVDWVRVYEKND
jgi:beta-glucanase (GH16 family)